MNHQQSGPNSNHSGPKSDKPGPKPNKTGQNRAKLEHAMFILSTPSSPSHTYTQPSSVHHRSSGLAMAETEFRDSERITLLTALQKTLNANVPSTIWANLWLSHIDRLRTWAAMDPVAAQLTLMNRL